MIIFDKVSKKYPNGVIALRNINLKIEQGEFVYLIGPSGSGKSTLMKLIYREERPSRGKIQVGKFIVHNIKPRQIPYLRRHVGVVFQDFKLLTNRTVFENVAFTLEVTGQAGKHIKKYVEQALQMVDLLDKAHQYPNTLSGGEQQRVAIARAIVNRPAILIADEPTGNLDPKISREIFELLERINRSGTTVLMGTHNQQLVNEFSHRVVQMDDGRIVRDSHKGAYEL